ncbi:MAG: NUDIX hydrolase [Chitinophagales bacterium]|nr:NUDIX hydrolase [Chitinophagales bacterium]MDW8393598.1 NUDIX hydrolase [Chitinophagales bacterium]
MMSAESDQDFSTPPLYVTVRVYGICLDNENRILLSDERLGQLNVTKFPGGGLIPGEGILDCLHREWKEETGAGIASARHFYTTDFFIRSAFDPKAQVICAYYLLDANQPIHAPFSNQPDFFEAQPGKLRWHSLEHLTPECFFFPSDQVVCRLLLKKLLPHRSFQEKNS